jgi:excisionase family DNA binding protein
VAGEKYLSPEEVGGMFRASRWTVRRWVEAGRLPAIRIGRRLLIPAEAVDKLVRAQQTPNDVENAHYVRLALTRTPPPRYDYFERSFTETEVDRLVDIILDALRKGGFPEGTFEIKKEGIMRIIHGQETAPAAFWRFLCDGIERMRQLAAGSATGVAKDQNK